MLSFGSKRGRIGIRRDGFGIEYFYDITQPCSSIAKTNLSIVDDDPDHDYRDWKELTCKGLVTYDAVQASHRPQPYQWVMIPSNPLHISMIPENISQIIKRTYLGHISFRNCRTISTKDIHNCSHYPE